MPARNEHGSPDVADPPGPGAQLVAAGDTPTCSTPITVVLELIERYGDFARYRTLYGTFSLVNRPSLVREVLCSSDYVRNRLLTTVLGDGLLSSNGAHWEQQRRLMLPTFKPSSIEAMVETFRRVAEGRAAAWSERLGCEPTLDLTRDIYRIALSNVGQALFETVFEDRFLDAFDCVIRELAAIQNAAAFGFPLIRRANSAQMYREALSVVDDAAFSLLSRGQRDGCPHAKLLDVLQSHGGENGDAQLTRQQLRNEIVTMITAGHETTAAAICWALHSIASHPEIAERFHREVDELLGERAITVEDLPRLTYTRMIIDETLRVYPPVWIVARTAARDMELGGYSVPAGSGVLVSPFALHRHPEFWSDPERFDPERFSPGAAEPVPYSYFPFLAGRHLCLGKHFALTEMIVVLVTLAQRYRFYGNGDPVNCEALVSLRIQGGLKLRLEPRRAGSNRPC